MTDLIENVHQLGHISSTRQPPSIGSSRECPLHKIFPSPSVSESEAGIQPTRVLRTGTSTRTRGVPFRPPSDPAQEKWEKLRGPHLFLVSSSSVGNPPPEPTAMSPHTPSPSDKIIVWESNYGLPIEPTDTLSNVAFFHLWIRWLSRH